MVSRREKEPDGAYPFHRSARVARRSAVFVISTGLHFFRRVSASYLRRTRSERSCAGPMKKQHSQPARFYWGASPPLYFLQNLRWHPFDDS